MNGENEKNNRLEELKAKYKDAMVSVVKSEVVLPYIKTGFTCRKDAQVKINNIVYPLRSIVSNNAEGKLRAEAELDPSYKQLVMYVLLKSKDGRYFVTKRIGGDSRLIGGYSLGTGGHVDGGEDIFKAMYRELKEEVGIDHNNIFTTQFNGFIYDDSSEVSSVHLGLAFTTMVNDPDAVSVKEPEKLQGAWMTHEEVQSVNDSGRFETWSNIMFTEVILNGEV